MTAFVSNPVTITVQPGSSNWAAAIGENQIAAVSLNTLLSQNPNTTGNAIYDPFNQFYRVVGAWNSAVYMPDFGSLGSVFFWGGGDGDYWGTQVSCFDLSTQRWRRLTEPSTAFTPLSNFPQGSDPWTVDPLFYRPFGEHGGSASTIGGVAVPHTYDLVTPVPASDPNGGAAGKLCAPARAFCYDLFTTGNCHMFDPTTATWERYTQLANPPTVVQSGASCYDPVRHRVWWYQFTDNIFHWVDLASHALGSVELVATFPDTLSMVYYPASAHGHPSDAIIITGFLNGSWGLWYFNPAAPADLRKLTITGPVPGPHSGGMCYCDDLDCFFLYDESATDRSQVWKFTPNAGVVNGTWTSTAITMTGTIPPAISAGPNNGMYKRFMWASKVKRIMWFSESGGQMYAYRPTGVA